LLAGLVQAPSTDDPFCHPAAARGRQQAVLSRLRAEGDIPPPRRGQLELRLSRSGHPACRGRPICPVSPDPAPA
jgi:membrane peptidoglycan carboxypeptidase